MSQHLDSDVTAALLALVQPTQRRSDSPFTQQPAPARTSTGMLGAGMGPGDPHQGEWDIVESLAAGARGSDSARSMDDIAGSGSSRRVRELLMKAAKEWAFDIFTLQAATGNRPLSTLAFYLITVETGMWRMEQATSECPPLVMLHVCPPLVTLAFYLITVETGMWRRSRPHLDFLRILIIIEGLSLLQSIPPTTAYKQTRAQKKRGIRARKLLGAN